MPMRIKTYKRPGTEQPRKRRPKPTHPFYSSTAWKRLRAQYRYDHPVCEVCGVNKTEIVHHLLSIKVDPGGALDPENLKAVCVTCHNRWHASLRKAEEDLRNHQRGAVGTGRGGRLRSEERFSNFCREAKSEN